MDGEELRVYLVKSVLALEQPLEGTLVVIIVDLDLLLLHVLLDLLNYF